MIVRQKDEHTFTIDLADEEIVTLKERADKEGTEPAAALHAAVVIGWDTAFGDKEE